MRIKVLLLALVSLALYSCSNNNKSAIAEHSIEGKIYSISYKEYEALVENGEVVAGDYTRNSNTIYFDTNGNIIEDNIHNRKGQLVSKKVYEYTEEGKISKITNTTLRNLNVEHNYQFVYSYKDDKLDIIREYKDGALSLLKKYYYNGDNISKISTYDNNDGLLDNTEYKEYQGNNPTVIVYGNNAYENITTVKYKDGLWVEKVIDNSSTISVQRDKNGLPLSSSKCIFTFVNEYNLSSYDIVYKYEYDQQGNWIKRISYIESSNKPIYILEREITYY